MNELKRLFLAVFLLTAAEVVAVVHIRPGWLSLFSGAVGSIILIIPPLRLEIWKALRARFKQRQARVVARSEDLRQLDKQLDEKYRKKIEEHETADALLLVLGGVLLAFYFLFQIPYKLELIDKAELSREIEQIRREYMGFATSIDAIQKKQSEIGAAVDEIKKQEGQLAKDIDVLKTKSQSAITKRTSPKRAQGRASRRTF